MNASSCPQLLPALVIGDSPTLLASVASVLAQEGHYLPLCEGPRMMRLDADLELSRRHNLAARIRPKAIFLATLGEGARKHFKTKFPARRCFELDTVDDLRSLPHTLPMGGKKVLTWGRDQIGIGLLKALREKRRIEFVDAPSPLLEVSRKFNLLVACERGDDLAEVLAANYAYSIGADFELLPEIANDDADEILERFYSLYDDRESPPTANLRDLEHTVRSMAGGLDVKGYGHAWHCVRTAIAKPTMGLHTELSTQSCWSTLRASLRPRLGRTSHGAGWHYCRAPPRCPLIWCLATARRACRRPKPVVYKSKHSRGSP